MEDDDQPSVKLKQFQIFELQDEEVNAEIVMQLQKESLKKFRLAGIQTLTSAILVFSFHNCVSCILINCDDLFCIYYFHINFYVQGRI